MVLKKGPFARKIVIVLLIVVLSCTSSCINDNLPRSTEHSATTPETTSVPSTTSVPTTPIQTTTVPTTPEDEISSPAPIKSPPPQPEFADKMDLWNLKSGPHLRGANIYQRRVYPELDGLDFMGHNPVGPPYTQEDFSRLAALGANYVNISHPGLFTETPPYTLDQNIQDNLDNLLDMIAKADMFAVISFRTGPGRSEFTFMLEDVGDWFDESYLNDTIWQDQAAQDAWGAMWRYTAERYRDNPIVIGYDLMVEPNSNEVGSNFINDRLGIWDPDEFYANYENTLYDWNQLYPHIIAAIHEVDPDTPILVGGNGYSAVEWLPYLKVISNPHMVCVVHQYAPHQYTHQWWNSRDCTYPGTCDTDWDGNKEQLDRIWLENLLSTIDRFMAKYDVAIAVNEFGVVRWVPGATEFMDDQMDLFEQRGMNYALWSWETSWKLYEEEVDAFNFRYGPDPHNHKDIASSDMIDVIIKYWGYNTIRPSNVIFAGSDPTTGTPAPPATETPSPSEALLAHVSHWLYMIDVNLEPEIVERIVTSTYDMVVLDFIPSEENNTEYPMAEVVTQLHNAPHPKLVIAYIDIGEAEEYRTYWQTDWRVGNPKWIAGEDPDGWEGNFPVAYWYNEWRDIWLGKKGYLQAILDAGFDGVYLDWIEAYSDDNVITLAKRDDVDPLEEMVRWVKDIAEFTRAQQSDFIVIAQNAAELAVCDDYLAIVDAVAQEQVWFDGGADNNPPGDCPLPRTEAEIDTESYRTSLSIPCRRCFDNNLNSPLHTSSEEYLHYLAIAKDKGKIIFTVDYALKSENIAWVYNMSRALGFVSFVSNRALDRYIEPWD